MISNKKLVVIMPAYNAENTLRQSYDELPHEYVDDVILVDDASSDRTVKIANEMGIKTIVHKKNMGYGANQKTCYREVLKQGADIVVMLHPDYQYSPRLVTAMAFMIVSGHYDVVIGSRILGGKALKGGMPTYKYIANRFLTLIENMILGIKLSEYHTGYRAFTREVLETLPLEENSDDFVFDNEILAQAAYFGFRIGEISCPARYFEDASSINFARSVKYGLGVLATTVKYALQKLSLINSPIFNKEGDKIIKKAVQNNE
jgi:glycosyltransferase involved in cell wall biosynthesis